MILYVVYAFVGLMIKNINYCKNWIVRCSSHETDVTPSWNSGILTNKIWKNWSAYYQLVLFFISNLPSLELNATWQTSLKWSHLMGKNCSIATLV